MQGTIKRLIPLIFSLGAAFPAFSQGDNVSLLLNDQSAGLEFNNQISKTVEAGAQYIYHENNGSFADIKVNATHANGIHQIAMGGKLIASFTKNRKNAQAIALGGTYRLVFSQQFALHLQGYYTPSVLAFSSLDQYAELDAHIEFKVIPTLAILGGYRYMPLKYDNESKLNFQDNFYFGAKFNF